MKCESPIPTQRDRARVNIERGEGGGVGYSFCPILYAAFLPIVCSAEKCNSMRRFNIERGAGSAGTFTRLGRLLGRAGGAPAGFYLKRDPGRSNPNPHLVMSFQNLAFASPNGTATSFRCRV